MNHKDKLTPWLILALLAVGILFSVAMVTKNVYFVTVGTFCGGVAFTLFVLRD